MIEQGWGNVQEQAQRMSIGITKISDVAKSKLMFISSEPVSYEGHYLNGRMEPCTGYECIRCLRGLGKQKRFCFWVWNNGLQRIEYFEVGILTADKIREYAEKEGNLRGLELCFIRENKRTGPISVLKEATDINQVTVLPLTPFPMDKYLFSMWTKWRVPGLKKRENAEKGEKETYALLVR